MTSRRRLELERICFTVGEAVFGALVAAPITAQVLDVSELRALAATGIVAGMVSLFGVLASFFRQRLAAVEAALGSTADGG